VYISLVHIVTVSPFHSKVCVAVISKEEENISNMTAAMYNALA
jgi:hypothetical protein